MTQSDTAFNFLLQLDNLCDEYESKLNQGDLPRIEDFVDRVEPHHQSELIRELIELEVAVRSTRGESVSREELIDRYADLLHEHPVDWDETNEVPLSTKKFRRHPAFATTVTQSPRSPIQRDAACH